MKKNQKAMPVGRQGFAPVFVLIALALAVGVAWYFYSYKQNLVLKSAENQTLEKSSQTKTGQKLFTGSKAVLLSTVDWLKYTSSDGSHSFLYPKDWKVEEVENSIFINSTNFDYRINIHLPEAYDPRNCLFFDDPRYEGFMDVPYECIGDYIEIESQDGTIRRRWNQNGSWYVYTKEVDNYFIGAPSIEYYGLNNYNENTAQTMDTIISTFK